MDGLDVLFRIALGILRSNEAELLRCESVPAVYVSLENLPTRMWEADKLLQVGICLSFFNTNSLNIFWFYFWFRIILVGSRPSRFARSFTDCWQTQSTCRIAQSTHFLESHYKFSQCCYHHHYHLMYRRKLWTINSILTLYLLTDCDFYLNLKLWQSSSIKNNCLG